MLRSKGFPLLRVAGRRRQFGDIPMHRVRKSLATISLVSFRTCEPTTMSVRHPLFKRGGVAIRRFAMKSIMSAATDPDVLPPPRAPLLTTALFVDVDGTLLDISRIHPDAVVVDPALPATLRSPARAARRRTRDRQRTIARDVDALLGSGRSRRRRPARRGTARADGSCARAPSDPTVSLAARARAIEAAASIPGRAHRGQGRAIALHYRAAPDAEFDVRRAAIAMLDAPATATSCCTASASSSSSRATPTKALHSRRSCASRRSPDARRG